MDLTRYSSTIVIDSLMGIFVYKFVISNEDRIESLGTLISFSLFTKFKVFFRKWDFSNTMLFFIAANFLVYGFVRQSLGVTNYKGNIRMFRSWVLGNPFSFGMLGFEFSISLDK